MDSDRLTQKDWWDFSLQLSIGPSGTCFKAEDLEKRRLGGWGQGRGLAGLPALARAGGAGMAMRNS